MAAPGSLVAWWKENGIAFAVVAGHEKQRVRLVGPGGHEDRVPPTRIAVVLEPTGHVPGATPEERAAAGRRAAAAADRSRVRGAALDVAALWDVVRDAPEQQALAELASLGLGDDEPAARAATAWALIEDGMHFVRRAEAWEARSTEAVAEIRLQRLRESDRASERRLAMAAMAVAVRGEGFESQGTATERKIMDALDRLAVFDETADEARRQLAIEVLDELGVKGDRPGERAFRALRRMGHFASDDENLTIRRFGLRREFPDEVVAAAEAAAAGGWSRTGRADRTGLHTITVDGPRTREIDDALSVETIGPGRARLGVHIADPAAFVEPGGVLDREALERTTSHYLPDLHLPMFPAALSERAASLVEGEERPALSFFALVDDAGVVIDARAERSVVRVASRLDYDQADAILASGEGSCAATLRSLAAVTTRLRDRRGRDGAVLLDAPEMEVRREADGTLRLDRIDPRSPSRRAVSEAMVLAGALAARFFVERSIPAIYRRQPAPSERLPLPEGDPPDPAAVRALRRSLRRGEIGLEPGRHFALGLDAYAQASSPLRRYQDLVAHRQIVSALDCGPPAYDVEALRRIAAVTERAEAEGRQAERAADAYWLLRWIESKQHEVVDAVVVDVSPVVVQLRETLVETRVPGLSGVVLGQAVQLRVERVNPRADLLLLRPA